MEKIKIDYINYEIIIKFLIARRKELGFSQNKIAIELGLSDQAVSNWERSISFPDIAYLSDIAKILETNVLSLIIGEHKEINLMDDINFDIDRFSKYLSKLRKSQNLKQSDLGKILNVSSQNISKYENGGFLPSLEILLKYCEYFNVSFLNVYYGLDDDKLYKVEIIEREDNKSTDSNDNLNNNLINQFKFNLKNKIIIFSSVITIFIIVVIILFSAFDNKHKVIIDLGNGEITTYKVRTNETIELPALPQKEGYTAKWNNDNNIITSNTKFEVIYIPNSYKITYLFEDDVIQSFTQEVIYNNTFELYIPDDVNFIGYTYNDTFFSSGRYNYAHDIVITGKYKKTFDVKVILDDNNILNYKINKGEYVTLPDLPIAPGYTTSWDSNDTLILSDKVFSCIYTPNTYKVTYVFENDKIQSFTQDIIYNNVFELFIPNDPDFLGYTYDDNPFSSGKYTYDHDITIIGTYIPFYNVSFVLGSQNTLNYKIKEGEHVELPDLPVKKGYTSKWDNTDTLITEDITYNVVYIPNTYKITYDFEDDSIVDYVQEVVYNEEFELYSIQSDIFLNYTYNDNEFNSGIYIYDYDITVIGHCSNFSDVIFILDKTNILIYSVKNGTNITLPDLPEKKGYTCKWDNTDTLITKETTFTVIYTPKKYKIKCIFEDDLYESFYIDVCYDQYVELDCPGMDNYTFVNYTYEGKIFSNGIYTYDHDIEIIGSFSKTTNQIFYIYDQFNLHQCDYVYTNREFIVNDYKVSEICDVNDVFASDEYKNYDIIGWKDKFGNYYEAGKQYIYQYDFGIMLYPVFEYYGDAFEYDLINDEVYITKYNLPKIKNLIIPDYINVNGNRCKVVELCPNSFLNIYFDNIFLSSHITTIKKGTFRTSSDLYTEASGYIQYNGTIEEWFNIDFEEIIANSHGKFFGLDRLKIINVNIVGDRFYIPENVKVIKKFSILFAYLYYLNIPNTVERIESYAIYDSTITIFEMNENVTIAEYNAFYQSRISGN